MAESALLLRGGHMIDPAQDFDGPADVRVRDGRIEAVGSGVAADVMTAEVVSVGPDTDLADAATLMLDKDVNRLPVVADGRLVGIISRADFVRLLAQDVPTEA